MTRKAKKVAVIGAGVSGLTTTKHLKASGLDVVVYERSATLGGVWAYDDRRPPEPTYPSTQPSIADFSLQSNDEVEDVKNGKANGFRTSPVTEPEMELHHAPPGPAYDGLTNNISMKLQELKGHPMKPGMGEFVNVRIVGDYIRSYAQSFNVEPLIKYNTRAEKLWKSGEKWRLRSSTLVRIGTDSPQKVYQEDEFDAVVIASGHYHASRVPDIPGLKEWKARWPNRVQHSKGYRKPDEFKNQNVLLIGGSVSAMDIAHEMNGTAAKIYESTRGGAFDLPETFLPVGTERIGEVALFETPTEEQNRPGTVTLVDGRVLKDIDRVVLCTGYHISLPFLRDFHDDFTPINEASDTVLVTDGTQYHNLHRDIFYIPDPTLMFVGIPFYVVTFNLYEFQAIAVAAVLSGRAWLPSQEEMRKEYHVKLEKNGHGRRFHALKDDAEVAYVREVVEWLNEHAETTGGGRVEGHSEAWLAENELKWAKLAKMFEVSERLEK